MPQIPVTLIEYFLKVAEKSFTEKNIYKSWICMYSYAHIVLNKNVASVEWYKPEWW